MDCFLVASTNRPKRPEPERLTYTVIGFPACTALRYYHHAALRQTQVPAL